MGIQTSQTASHRLRESLRCSSTLIAAIEKVPRRGRKSMGELGMSIDPSPRWSQHRVECHPLKHFSPERSGRDV